MIRLSNWKRNHFYTKKYTFLKSAPPELSNDGSHGAKSGLCQKLLPIVGFPGTFSIGNSSETINAWTLKKSSSGPTFNGQLIDISF